MELILDRVQAVLTLSWQNPLLAAHSQPGEEQRRCTASLLVSVSRRLLRTHKQSKSVLSSALQKLKVVAWGEVQRQHHLRIWFWRQSSSGLDLWLPHIGSSTWNCCSIVNILGHHLWFFVPFSMLANEDYSLSDQAGYEQLGLHLLVLYHIFKCRSVTYFLWSCIHKRALSFSHHNLKHLFLPLKTGSL